MAETASRASSRWWEGVMDVGSETRRYLFDLDMMSGRDAGRTSETYELKTIIWAVTPKQRE